ncbi:hypothetical protein [Georgenia sp. SUBG003]|uniref:hypothetical protein n=1 Tax=Georgenia sp. SUBG003 TaxID=1497974 RepID=UPI003AB34BD7
MSSRPPTSPQAERPARQGTYDFIDTGVVGTDAIRLGFLYQPREVQPVGDFAVLDSSVDPAFDDTKNRPMLTQTFREIGTGEVFTVSINHLKSKGSACAGDPDTGDGQGNCNLTRTVGGPAVRQRTVVDAARADGPGRVAGVDVRGALGEAVGLVLPVECAGCGRWDVVLCGRCEELLGQAPVRCEEDAALLAGGGTLPVLPTWSLGDYRGPLRSLVLGWKSHRRLDVAPAVLAAAGHARPRTGGGGDDAAEPAAEADKTEPAAEADRTGPAAAAGASRAALPAKTQARPSLVGMMPPPHPSS